LALANVDPTYSAGLADLADWRFMTPHSWFYSPPVSRALAAPIPYKDLKEEIISNL
jgi:hypothetical protein